MKKNRNVFWSLTYLYWFSKLCGSTCLSIKGRPNERTLLINKKDFVIFVVQKIIMSFLYIVALYKIITYRIEIEFQLEYIPELTVCFSYYVFLAFLFYKQIQYRKLLINIYKRIQYFSVYLEVYRCEINYKRIRVYTIIFLVVKLFLASYLIWNLILTPDVLSLPFFWVEMIYITSETQMTIFFVIMYDIIKNFNALISYKAKELKRNELFCDILKNCISYHYDLWQMCCDVIKIYIFIIIKVFIGFSCVVYIAFVIAIYDYDVTMDFLWTGCVIFWNLYNLFGICVLIYFSAACKEQVC